MGKCNLLLNQSRPSYIVQPTAKPKQAFLYIVQPTARPKWVFPVQPIATPKLKWAFPVQLTAKPKQACPVLTTLYGYR